MAAERTFDVGVLSISHFFRRVLNPKAKINKPDNINSISKKCPDNKAKAMKGTAHFHIFLMSVK